MTEVSVMNSDIYLKNKMDRLEEARKNNLGRKLESLKKQLKNMRKMKIKKKEIMNSRELKILMFLLLVDALELKPYKFDIFKDMIYEQNDKLYKKLTPDLIYEVQRIFNMTKKNKDKEIQRLLSFLDEKQISELENNNKYLEYVKKNFYCISNDDQDENSVVTQESENIGGGTIIEYNIMAYDLLLKIASKLTGHIFTSERCRKIVNGKKLDKLDKKIDYDKMKIVNKYLKYKILNDHIKYISNEENLNIRAYLMGKLDKCAYDFDDSNKKMMDLCVKMNIF